MLKQFVAHRVLPWLNHFLRLGRVKLVPWNAANRDLGQFVDHLKSRGMEFRSVIDVGVAFGTPGLHDRCHGATFYLVDPVPELADQLKVLARQLNGQAFNVAAGAENGEMTFFVHDDTSGSSAFRQQEGALLDGAQVIVPVRRLDGLIAKDLARPSLLKIDTQGSELEVIKGAEGLLSNIDVVIAETSFHEMRKGIPQMHEVIAAMHERGFVPYEVIEGFYRPSDGALGQVDIAFIPVDSPLRSEPAAFSAEQAERYARQYAR